MNDKELQRQVNMIYKTARDINSKVNAKKMFNTEASMELATLVGRQAMVMNEILKKLEGK